MNIDTMKIEILEDGTIKMTTDQVSGPNHANAETFAKMMATLAGGESTRTKRSDAHHHHHHHDHDHDHDHHHH